MTYRLALAFCFLLESNAPAFDPIGPPPVKTLEWTVGFVSQRRIPAVHIKNATVEEALEFLRMPDIPDAYGFKIDYSKLKEPVDLKITIQDKNITILQAIAAVAQKVNADILIKPGVIVLMPRK